MNTVDKAQRLLAQILHEQEEIVHNLHKPQQDSPIPMDHDQAPSTAQNRPPQERAGERQQAVQSNQEEQSDHRSEKYQIVPADQLLAPYAFGPGKTCWTCGQCEWWHNAGRWICGTCHPQLRRNAAIG